MNKFIIFLALSFLVGFTKPQSTDNICRIFESNPTWYWKAKQTENKWGVPVAVQMAIIDQESRFDSEAIPRAKVKVKGKIKSKVLSSAYGFSQALKKTWAHYQQSTGTKSRRNEFAAATDFIGWYVNMTKNNLHISPKNTYALYLAYHEGLGGYKHHSYSKKPAIIKVAKNVNKKADIYQSQLLACQNQIEAVVG